MLEQRGLSYYALKKEFKFSPDTLSAWERGIPARPFSLRKLARILGMEYHVLVRNIGVNVLTRAVRRNGAVMP
jgi:hypothetical protein